MGAYTAFLDVALGLGSPALGLVAGSAGLGGGVSHECLGGHRRRFRRRAADELTSASSRKFLRNVLDAMLSPPIAQRLDQQGKCPDSRAGASQSWARGSHRLHIQWL
jgi:hypothetical protein